MFKKLLIIYLAICAGSFVIASIIINADFGNERILYGTLFPDYEKAVYKGIGVLCALILPIFMNVYPYIRQNKILRLLSFFLWPVLVYVFETARSNPQEFKNMSVVFFSVFACLLLGYIYFQKMIKGETKKKISNEK